MRNCVELKKPLRTKKSKKEYRLNGAIICLLCRKNVGNKLRSHFKTHHGNISQPTEFEWQGSLISYFLNKKLIEKKVEMPYRQNHQNSSAFVSTSSYYKHCRNVHGNVTDIINISDFKKIGISYPQQIGVGRGKSTIHPPIIGDYPSSYYFLKSSKENIPDNIINNLKNSKKEIEKNRLRAIIRLRNKKIPKSVLKLVADRFYYVEAWPAYAIKILLSETQFKLNIVEYMFL